MNRKKIFLFGGLFLIVLIDALSLLYGWHEHFLWVKWLFRLFNFAVYVILIGLLLRAADAKSKLHESREAAQRALREAEVRHQNAEDRLQEVNRIMEGLDADIKARMDKAHRDAEAVKQEVLKQAECESERLLKKTEEEIVMYREAAKEVLRRFAATRIAELASADIKQHLDDRAHERLFTRSLKDIREVFRG